MLSTVRARSPFTDSALKERFRVRSTKCKNHELVWLNARN